MPAKNNNVTVETVPSRTGMKEETKNETKEEVRQETKPEIMKETKKESHVVTVELKADPKSSPNRK